MFTTDLAMRLDPIYGRITRRWLEHPEELEEAFAKAWYKKPIARGYRNFDHYACAVIRLFGVVMVPVSRRRFRRSRCGRLSRRRSRSCARTRR